MNSNLNRTQETTPTTGAGTVTLSGTATAGYQTWSDAGAVSGRQYPYLILDGSNSEWGWSTVTNSGGTWTLSRDFVIGSIISGVSGTTKVTLSGSATVACTDNTSIVDPTWRILTIQSGTSTVGGMTVNACNETFTISAGQKIEIKGEIYKAQGGGASLICGVGSNGFNMASQGDHNQVPYKSTGGSLASLGSVSAVSSYDFTGVHDIDLHIGVNAASSNYVWAFFNGLRYPGPFSALNYVDTGFTMIGTLAIGVSSPDYTKCRVLARVLG